MHETRPDKNQDRDQYFLQGRLRDEVNPISSAYPTVSPWIVQGGWGYGDRP